MRREGVAGNGSRPQIRAGPLDPASPTPLSPRPHAPRRRAAEVQVISVVVARRGRGSNVNGSLWALKLRS